jgi:hypothetical protein
VTVGDSVTSAECFGWTSTRARVFREEVVFFVLVTSDALVASRFLFLPAEAAFAVAFLADLGATILTLAFFPFDDFTVAVTVVVATLELAAARAALASACFCFNSPKRNRRLMAAKFMFRSSTVHAGAGVLRCLDPVFDCGGGLGREKNTARERGELSDSSK